MRWPGKRTAAGAFSGSRDAAIHNTCARGSPASWLLLQSRMAYLGLYALGGDGVARLHIATSGRCHVDLAELGACKTTSPV